MRVVHAPLFVHMHMRVLRGDIIRTLQHILRYVEKNMLVNKRLAGDEPEVNLIECANETAHSGFEKGM